MSKALYFSYNWNNKLDCKAFTTMRLSNYFAIGDEVEIHLNHIKQYDALIVDKRSIKFHNINRFVSFLDTGYSVEECKKVLQTMYKKKNIDWKKQEIYLYLIKRR